MKNLVTILLMAISLTAVAQTTLNPDTVCSNAIAEQYFVTNTLTSTYNWIANGGGSIITAGQGTNSITVDWGAAPGLYPNAIEVTESNAAGCPGAPILLDVFVLALSANALGSFCPGDPATTLVGTPAGGTWSGTGVTGSDFDPSIGVGTYTLTYTLAGCSASISAVVNSGPVTGPIQHF